MTSPTFDYNFLETLDDESGVLISLTELQANALLQAVHFLLDDYRWQNITESEFNELEPRISDAIDKLLSVQ